MSDTSTYRTWAAMIQRCTNPKSSAYKWYGEKGIGVCDRWKKDFLNFLSDMGERPDGTTLDRIDPSQDYFKKNCSWETVLVQQNNRRNTRWRNEFEWPAPTKTCDINFLETLDAQYERKTNRR